MCEAVSGVRAVPLPRPAAPVLTVLPRGRGNPRVFPDRVRGTSFRHLNESLQVVPKQAGLEDVRIRDLRPTLASLAATPHLVATSSTRTETVTSRRCPIVDRRPWE